VSGPPSPVVFLGFDAAEIELVQEGIDDGWLPVVKQLVMDGRCVPLGPMPSLAHNTAWMSMSTGTDLGDHQVLIDRQLEPGSYRIVDAPAGTGRRPPFWRYLSDAGVPSTIASVYGAALLEPFRGTQVLGWGSADPQWGKFGRVAIDPPEVQARLRRAVGGRPELSYVENAPRTTAEYRRYRDKMLRSVRDQELTMRELLDSTEWQFFFASFGEAHQAGHLLWHLEDQGHPLHDPSASEDVRDALRAVYRAVDSSVGRIVEVLPLGCRVFLVTPHGMGPNFVDDPADTVLTAGGWLQRWPSAAVGSGRRGRALGTAWSVTRRLVPTRVRIAARMKLPRDRLLAGLAFADVDWSATRAFALPSDLVSAVRVNLAGREPQGSVQPGAGYERLLDELSQTFLGLRFGDSGKPAVHAAVRFDQLLGRPVDGPLPDLLVVWANTGEQIRQLRSAELGAIDLSFRDPRTGQHRQTGFIIGMGPGIPGSSSSRMEGPTAGLLDVAPTALALLGVDKPAALPGRPIPAFCADVPATSSERAGPGQRPEQAETR
jgi:predicted AlkP superfamily phosphohydrolase/phosphomutase